MTMAFDPATAPQRASELRRRLREPPNAVADRGITMRNGRAVRIEPEPPSPPPAEPPVDLGLYRLIRQAADIEEHLASGGAVSELPLGRIPFRTIQLTVGRFYDVTLAALLSHSRLGRFVRARQVAMFLCHRIKRATYPETGRRFGGRDHTTVLHAVRKIAALRATDERLRDEIQIIIMRLAERTGQPINLED